MNTAVNLKLTRRTFLCFLGLTGMSILPEQLYASGDKRVKRIEQIFKDYDEQGFHRTGTETDTRNAHWLVETIKRMGQTPRLVSFPFSRIDPIKTTLRVGNREIEGIPYFDCEFTDSNGIRGRLGDLSGDALIAVGNPWGSEAKAFTEARRENRFRAMIAIADGSGRNISPGLILMNAEQFRHPFGPPVLQVSSEDGPWLRDAAATGKDAHVIVDVKRTPVEAFNVEVRVKGKDAGLPPVVVMTPRSGWYHCTSERGGGVACWLEMIRILSAKKPNRDVWFIASTGHELGHVGLDHFLEQHKNLIKDARLWIHLGANFSAAKEPAVLLQTSDKDLESLALEAIGKKKVLPANKMPPGRRPHGEARNIFDGGGRYISLLGSNGLFHHIDDRWPHAVDMDKTIRLIDAFTDILVQMAS